ncbi:MAG: hypothetical protein IMF17_07660 [Proteobacteria bacterium]|nr:hypothetical protein [Pseudomonadota bacterium]
MKYLIIFYAFFLLSGCADDFEWSDTGYPEPTGEIKVTTQLGIQVNYQDDNISDNEVSLIVDSAWVDTQNCTGIFKHPTTPFIIEFFNEQLPEAYAVGLPDIVYIRVGTYELYRLHPRTLKHEMTHILLWINGVSGYANWDHGSPLFDKCSSNPP